MQETEVLPLSPFYKSWFRKKMRFVKVFETGMALMMLTWATVLFMPGSTFSTSASYASMAAVASETTWGTICLVIGLSQCIGMILPHRQLRRAAHLVASGFWVSVGYMFIHTTFYSTTWIYFIVGALTGYLYWKVGEQG